MDPHHQILIACDKLKGSLTAEEAGAAIRRGLQRAMDTDITVVPVSDGGEGTARLLASALGIGTERLEVESSFGPPLQLSLVWLDESSALIESAQLSGAAATGLDSHPLNVGTFAVGNAILAARERGATQIVVSVGGSRTVDGGLGALIALGADIRDVAGNPVSADGRGLLSVASAQLAPAREALQGVDLVVWCDVLSPLLGSRGARLYMAQKGASADDCDKLEAGLTQLADVIAPEFAAVPGTGAAGGLPFGLASVGARLESGADRMLETLRVPEQVDSASLVIGAEGKVDTQTAEGKAMAALARLCQARQTPLVLLCGARDRDLSALYERGVNAIIAAQLGPDTLEHALSTAAESLETVAFDLGRLLSL